MNHRKIIELQAENSLLKYRNKTYVRKLFFWKTVFIILAMICLLTLVTSCQSAAVFVEAPPDQKLKKGDQLILEYQSHQGDSVFNYTGTIIRKGGRK